MGALGTREFWLGLLVAILGFWVAPAGAMWVWGGMSTVVGDMSSTCERVTLKYSAPAPTPARSASRRRVSRRWGCPASCRASS